MDMIGKFTGKLMMLPIIMVMPVFSFLAGIIWWVCFITGKRSEETPYKAGSPTVETEKHLLTTWVLVNFAGQRYFLFRIKTVHRDKSGSIK